MGTTFTIFDGGMSPTKGRYPADTSTMRRELVAAAYVSQQADDIIAAQICIAFFISLFFAFLFSFSTLIMNSFSIERILLVGKSIVRGEMNLTYSLLL